LAIGNHVLRVSSVENKTNAVIARWEDGRIAEEYLFLESPPAPMMMNQTGDNQ
jgi:hypothetical protein